MGTDPVGLFLWAAGRHMQTQNSKRGRDQVCIQEHRDMWMDGAGETERTSWEIWAFLTLGFGGTGLIE